MLSRGGKKQEDSLLGIAGFFKYFLPASHLTSFSQEKGTHKSIFASRDQRGHGWGCKEVWVSRWNYWDIQEISSPPCEELTLGIPSRGTLRLKMPNFSISTQLAHQVLFLRSTYRSSANVFFAKYTLRASRSRSSFFALVIGLFLISSCRRILCDKWMVWWDRSTPRRGCWQWKALTDW